MHLFISAGEPSGDLHASNLITRLLQREPGARIVGFGGEKSAAAGSRLLYPLTDLAVMWFGRALLHLPKFFRVAKQAEEYFRTERPDAVVLIDYPGFHWHIAKRAHRQGIPVYYFVPPQLWAWAGWRVKKMRKWIHTVLTSLPFEDEWYRARGVRTHFIGHPYFDEIHERTVDASQVARWTSSSGPIVGVLPGSRKQEVTSNLPIMLNAVARIRRERPEIRFLIASFNDEQAEMARQISATKNVPVEIVVKKTPEVISASTACLAVSGSVGLELMTHQVPSVVLYKVSGLARRLGRLFMRVPHISLVNLMAKQEVFPEYLTEHDVSPQMADHILNWLNDESRRQTVVRVLADLSRQYAIPGACDRAADFLTERVGAVRPLRQAA